MSLPFLVGPAVLASVLAGADVLSTAMPPSKPTTSWLGGFALKKKVAKSSLTSSPNP